MATSMQSWAQVTLNGRHFLQNRGPCQLMSKLNNVGEAVAGIERLGISVVFSLMTSKLLSPSF